MSSRIMMIAIAALLLVTAGQVRADSNRHYQGARPQPSLTDAMREAAGQRENTPESGDGERRGKRRPPADRERRGDSHHSSEVVYSYGVAVESNAPPTVQYASQTAPTNSVADGGGGRVSVGSYANSVAVNNGGVDGILEYAAYLEYAPCGECNSTVGFAFLAGNYQFADGSLQSLATYDASSAGYLIYYKGYLPTDETLFTPYWMAGFGRGELRWSYNSPVHDSWGYPIYSDSLDYVDLRIGVGAEVGKRNGISMAVSAMALWRTYNDGTSEGFKNDMFRSAVSPVLGASLAFRF